jgi:hypothetical protein
MHNQHSGLSQTLADQHRSELQQHADRQRLLPTASQPRHRRTRSRRWWQLHTRRPWPRAS